MRRLFALAILAVTLPIPTAQAGSPSTTLDAKAGITRHYSDLVRESAYTNTRVTVTCHNGNLRGVIVRNLYTCRTNLYAGSPRRLRVVSDWLLYCDSDGWCSIEKRLYTWRY